MMTGDGGFIQWRYDTSSCLSTVELECIVNIHHTQTSVKETLRRLLVDCHAGVCLHYGWMTDR